MGAYENALGAPVEHIVITNDSLVVLEDSSSTIDLLDNDLILNITSFTLAIVDSADNGTIALVGDTALTYTPDENFFGYDTLSYRVFSSEAADTGLVLITVTAVNDAPVASTGTVTTNEDTDYSGTLSASDVGEDALTYSVLTSPVNGTISITSSSSGTYTYSPTANYNGSDSLTFTASDGTLLDTAKVSITVTAVNDAPVASAGTVTTNEDTDYTGRLSASDPDGSTLTYSTVTNPSNGSLTLNSLTALSFDGDADYVELNNFQPFNDISAMVWVKTDYTGAQKRILDYDGGGGNDMFFVGVENGYPMVKLREDTNSPLQLTGSSMIANNEWHHIAYVRDGNQNYFYVDGVLEDNSEGNEFLVDNTVNIFISSSTPSKEFDGNIDEVAIWSIALNSSQKIGRAACRERV